MIAEPALQQRLLDLQAVDAALSQLAHRRATLAELAVIAECDRASAATRSELVQAQTAVSDAAADQRRLETDVDSVRQRAERDQQRMAASGVPAKEISGLQHEVASLARRQSTLEDELLELMERVEQAQATAAKFETELAELAQRRADADAAREAAFSDIDATVAAKTEQRQEIAAELPEDLVTLYDKIRVANAGIGAALLRQRRCDGCRIELAGSELATIRSAAADDVLRCENCRRILVRTSESGL